MSNYTDSRDSADSPFYQLTIEKILGLPFSKDNKVRLLESGQETFQAIIDALSNAREIICIEFYIFKDDETGRRVADELKRKAKEGVNVYLLYDHYGSFFTSRAFWTDLRKAGIQVRVSQPFRWSAPRGYLARNHKKLLLIDGIKAFTGGFNIADEYHGHFKKKKKVWRDMGIYMEGPICFTMLTLFKKSWKTWKGPTIPWGNNNIQSHADGISVIPIFSSTGRTRRSMKRLLLYSIKNANKTIYITTAYFIPSRKIIRAMIQASKRGVSLKLLLPGKSDVMSVFYAGRRYFKRLLKAGVEIYNYQGSILHSKTSVFDEHWSIIGSTNLDIQSLRINEESNVGVLDHNFSNHLIEVFNEDIQKSVKIDKDVWSGRPFYQKFLEHFFSLIMKKL